MDTELHVVLFPFMSHGHMLPILDIARLFTARGVKTTIISTPLNVPTFTKTINNNGTTKSLLTIEAFRFPSEEVGLPRGCENMEQVENPSILFKFIKAGDFMREQLEQYLEKTRPNCLVADMFFTWACDSASKFNIPTLVFHGTGIFHQCAKQVIQLYQPYKNVSSDTETFTLPRLPDEVKMTRLQIIECNINFIKLLESTREMEVKSYGVIVNSFYELEPRYADFLRGELRTRAWIIGPVSLCNRSVNDRVQRGKQGSIDEDVCLNWLESKQPRSVLYISFGSTVNILAPQLNEIAKALEASGHIFIWVIKEKNSEWMPPGFEQRTEKKGLIIRGWAPQILILEHESTGGFLTHCGWNSILEGISAGVPMLTWPFFADQFHNEILVVQILKIGVGVGSKKWGILESIDDMIKQNDIEKAIRELMAGEESKEMRNRVTKLKEMAWKAVGEGGSSYSDLGKIIEELKHYHASSKVLSGEQGNGI